MNTARRLFGRYQQQSFNNQCSSFFKSKVNRQFCNLNNSQLGPGQYQISLPLVKPQFQAIQKKNNTIIIRLNEKHSPVFQSASPRFKNPQQIFNISKTLKSEKQIQHLNIQRNQSQRKQKKSQRSFQAQKLKLKSQNYKVNIQSKSFTRKHDLIHSKSRYLQNYLQKQNGSIQISKQIQTIQIYQKQKKEKLQNILKNSKGSQWSKYKQERSTFWEINDQNPGPGSYRLKPKKVHKQHIDSWQFRSITQRKPFQPNQQIQKPLFFHNSHTIQVTWGPQKSQQKLQLGSKRKKIKNKLSLNKQKQLGKRQNNSQMNANLSLTSSNQILKRSRQK